MSTQHSQNKKTIKKSKLDKVDELVSSIAEYKRCAILKYCNENGVEKYQFDKLSISDDLQKLSLFVFLYSSMDINYCFRPV